MKNNICISTGSVYIVEQDMNKKIELLKPFPCDGIELNFAFAQDLVDFNITPENLEFLLRKRVTIHAPWKGIFYGDNSQCNETLNTIQNLYRQVRAELVNFHLFEGQDLSVVQKYDFNATLENDDWKKRLQTQEQVEHALRQNPKFGLTLDFAHVYSISPDNIARFIGGFKGRISQMHISYLDRTLKDHWFLYRHDSEKQRGLLRLIPEDIPLVLECVASDSSEVPLIADEIKYLRSI